MTRWEFEQIQSVLLGGEVEAASPPAAPGRAPFALPCRFRDEAAGRCRIYPARPLICRLFGLVEWLPCPVERWGVRLPDGVEIMRWSASLGPRPYEHWLHESLQNAHTEA
jgi:Fe-S-cluster containining protein